MNNRLPFRPLDHLGLGLLVYAAILTAAMLIAGCAVSREQVPADLLGQYDALQGQLSDEDPANDAQAEAELTRLEGQVLQRNAAPLAGLLPYGLGSALTALVPLLGRRGRKHYGNALKSISRGKVMNAAGDVLKAMGAAHSSPESAAAASQPKPS